MTGNKKVDRLPVLVSGKGVDQLLGVPKIPTSTGAMQAQAVFDILSDWDLCPKVAGLCFDATSSNTGIHNRACVLLERHLGRNLLHFWCRHHIHELILEAATVVCLGPSTGPDISLFKRLQEQWSYVDQTTFRAAQPIENPGEFNILTKEEIIEFANDQLKEHQPREDYRKLLKLCIVFVGGEPERGFHFRHPGALHRARWMAKAIYSLKLYLFRGQIKLTQREEKGLLDPGYFLEQIYVKAWFTAPNSISASANDLTLLK